ncbi:MAG: hypothetical protein JO369_02775, partial [Paucibacter sp.]|nr:hypothetical protein [Roseateles sp.]
IAADPSKRVGAQAAHPRGGRRGAGASAPAGGGSSPASGNAGWNHGGGAASAPASSASGNWAGRLPPDIAAKVEQMSPDERRAFFEKRRAERAAQGGQGSN